MQKSVPKIGSNTSSQINTVMKIKWAVLDVSDLEVTFENQEDTEYVENMYMYKTYLWRSL